MSGLRPAPGIALVEQGGVIYAAPLPDGPIVVLDGGAAAIWIAACDGPRRTIAERVAQATGADLAEVGPHADAFVDELLRRGLLVADVPT